MYENAFVALLAGAVLVILAGVVEFILWLRWNARYYQSGPVIFRREYLLMGAPDAPLDLDALQGSMRGGFFPPLLFRRLTSTDCGFRECLSFGLFSLHYSSLMRGLIRRDPVSHLVVIEGRLMWWNVFFLIYMVTSLSVVQASSDVFLPVVGMGAAIVALTYVTQAYRFSRVAQLAHEQMTRPSTGSPGPTAN